METSDIVKAKRQALNASQMQFAELVGVDQATISRWETGVSTPSRAEVFFIESLKPKRARK